jgi:ribonuclease HII
MKINIGIDEVGRGSFAGPVYVCAFATSLSPKKLRLLFPHHKLKDSKKLTKTGREDIFEKLKRLREDNKVTWAIGKRQASYIDIHGLTKSITMSIIQVLNTLQKQLQYKESAIYVSLDGGLSAPTLYTKKQTIVKGDETMPVIACASIVAKVLRDNYMKDLSKKYINYEFAKNVGYGTAKHRTNIQKYGITIEHRKSFLKKIKTL